MNEENTVPVWSGNYAPFRLVTFDDETWSTTLEKINDNTYDPTKLFRSSLNIDVGIAPLSLVVLFDGTLVIPRCSEIPKSKALTIFNKHATDLLLGGLLANEVSPDDVTPGRMNHWGYHRHDCPRGRYSKLSHSLRTCRADPDVSMCLLEPRTLTKSEYISHHESGYAVSQLLPANFPTVFLPSCTAFSDEKWERALILGWSSVELLIELIWNQKVLASAKVDGIRQKRRKDFLSDTRTWSSSTRIELLWQKGYINDALYALTDQARAARNAFIHSASECSPEDAKASILAALSIVELIASENSLSFEYSKIINFLDESTDYFRTPVSDESGRLLVEPKFWRYPDPAPGFSDWGERPFEKNPDIELKPIKK